MLSPCLRFILYEAGKAIPITNLYKLFEYITDPHDKFKRMGKLALNRSRVVLNIGQWVISSHTQFYSQLSLTSLSKIFAAYIMSPLCGEV